MSISLTHPCIHKCIHVYPHTHSLATPHFPQSLALPSTWMYTVEKKSLKRTVHVEESSYPMTAPLPCRSWWPATPSPAAGTRGWPGSGTATAWCAAQRSASPQTPAPAAAGPCGRGRQEGWSGGGWRRRRCWRPRCWDGGPGCGEWRPRLTRSLQQPPLWKPAVGLMMHTRRCSQVFRQVGV